MVSSSNLPRSTREMLADVYKPPKSDDQFAATSMTLWAWAIRGSRWLARLAAAAALMALLSTSGCSTPVEKAATERRKARKSLHEIAETLTATLDSSKVPQAKLRGNVVSQLEGTKGEDFRYRGIIAFDVSLPPIENEHYYERWSFECIYRDGEWRLRKVTAVPSATVDADNATKQAAEQLEPRVKELGDIPYKEYQWQ